MCVFGFARTWHRMTHPTVLYLCWTRNGFVELNYRVLIVSNKNHTSATYFINMRKKLDISEIYNNLLLIWENTSKRTKNKNKKIQRRVWQSVFAITWESPLLVVLDTAACVMQLCICFKDPGQHCLYSVDCFWAFAGEPQFNISNVRNFSVPVN